MDFVTVENLCVECGLPGPHSDTGQCIAALRDKLADLQLRDESMREKVRNLQGEVRRLKSGVGR